MTRRLVIRDMRAQQPALPEPPKHRRLPAGTVGDLVLVAFLAAWVMAMLLLLVTGCSSEPPPCVPTRPAAIVAECRAQYRQTGCATDPERLCPALVAACDKRIDQLTDAEVCTP